MTTAIFSSDPRARPQQSLRDNGESSMRKR